MGAPAGILGGAMTADQAVALAGFAIFAVIVVSVTLSQKLKTRKKASQNRSRRANGAQQPKRARRKRK